MTLHDQLEAVIKERLAVAQAATAGPWCIGEEFDGMRAGRLTVVRAGDPLPWGGAGLRVVTVDQTRRHHDEPTSPGRSEDNVAHIAANGPDRIIRDCTEDLAVLDRHRIAPTGSHLFCGPDCQGGDCGSCGVNYPCIETQSLARRYDITEQP